MPVDEEGFHVVFVARMRDGTYRCVEAVSWEDARRYFGNAAASIRKRRLTIDDFSRQRHSPEFRRVIYEREK